MLLDPQFFDKFGVEYDANDVIFCEFEPGEEFFFIQSGKVEIVKIVNNVEKTLDVLEDGDVFGEMAVLESKPRSASAIAKTPVKLLKFHRDNFDVLLKGNPQLAYKLLVIFSKRIYDAKRRLMILLLDDPQLKVIDVINMLVEANPLLDADSEITLPATAETIANWAGMKIEDVQKHLTHLVDLGKIEQYADRIIVKNIRDFQRVVATKRRNMNKND